jgi:hypothetical protein
LATNLLTGSRNVDCQGMDWDFLISQINGQSPAHIHVTWNDGSTETAPLTSGSGSSAAHYTTRSHDGTTLPIVATAVIYPSWSGAFVLSQKPCPPLTTAVILTATPAATPTTTSSLVATPTATSWLVAAATNTPAGTAMPTNSFALGPTPPATLTTVATATV